MKTSTQLFGVLPNGKEVQIFNFEYTNGLSIQICDFGASITSIIAPDKQGKTEEITAGFPTLESYLHDHPFLGVTVGRFANRIREGRFTIEGKTYNLPINNGPNHLHGGPGGFHTKLWKSQLQTSQNTAILRLCYSSPHMDQGYPGNLSCAVTYTMKEPNILEISYEAQSDATTHVNLTNHAYFNLGGFQKTIGDHHLKLNASHYLELDTHQIPTGNKIPCANTPFDFSTFQPLQKALDNISGGLDHCFVLHQSPSSKQQPDAILSYKPSGRFLEIYTSQPGIQVYTGNFLDGKLSGHNNTSYHQHSAICLETQHFPDSPNQPGFPSTLLNAGETYHEKNTWVFGIR